MLIRSAHRFPRSSASAQPQRPDSLPSANSSPTSHETADRSPDSARVRRFPPDRPTDRASLQKSVRVLQSSVPTDTLHRELASHRSQSLRAPMSFPDMSRQTDCTLDHLPKRRTTLLAPIPRRPSPRARRPFAVRVLAVDELEHDLRVRSRAYRKE